jgi:hypothetical protein
MAKQQQRRSGGGTRPRQMWAMNLAPLVAGARRGATHAAKTVSRERARARRKQQWWRQRWLVVTATGVAVAGAAAGTYAIVSKRRSAAPVPGAQSVDAAPRNGFRSTVETGRTRVADLARTVAHRVRRDGARGDAEPRLTLDGVHGQVVTEP